MSDQLEIVRCCICKKAKDIDDTDHCEVCDKNVCFECGLTDKHKCETKTQE
jgi:hypothetical protein